MNTLMSTSFSYLFFAALANASSIASKIVSLGRSFSLETDSATIKISSFIFKLTPY